MTDASNVKGLVIDMEPVLLNISQGLEAAQNALLFMEDKKENGNLHFILDALETRHEELRQRWKAVHAAVCRSEE